MEPNVVEIVGFRTTSDRVRRAVNVAMAALGLLAAAPLMVLIAALVKLTSRGPVLYSQPRVGRDRRNGTGAWHPEGAGNGNGDAAQEDGASVEFDPVRPAAFVDAGLRAGAENGRNGGPSGVEAPLDDAERALDAVAALDPDGDGRPGHDGEGPSRPQPVPDRRGSDGGGRVFTIYKFRTMYAGADDGGEVWASPDDDRVTPVGRVLRKLHLDELPQLFNVLKGDMNLVGPRPEQPEIFSRLARQIPGYRVRQQVRPGITGWAQVNHHYDRDLEDVRTKVELDLEYLERRSALEDLRIALATLPAVFDEAEGW